MNDDDDDASIIGRRKKQKKHQTGREFELLDHNHAKQGYRSNFKFQQVID